MARVKMHFFLRCAVCGWPDVRFGFTERVILRESVCRQCGMKKMNRDTYSLTEWLRSSCLHPYARIRVEIEGDWRIRQCLDCGARRVDAHAGGYREGEEARDTPFEEMINGW